MEAEPGELRRTFDAVAEDYQRSRPVASAEVFDDLMVLAGLRPRDRVLEIGCGTGQATVPLCERGLHVTAVELGPNLAAVARRRIAAFDDASVEVAAFEDWEPSVGRTGHRAVIAWNCLHWISPDVAYAKSAALLGSGGAMVVAGHNWTAPEGPGLWNDLQEDYAAAGIPGQPPSPPESVALGAFRSTPSEPSPLK